MTIGLPKIEVQFTGLANSSITRSAKGVACLIVNADTKTPTDIEVHTLKSVTDLEAVKSSFDQVNINTISDVFLSNVTKLYVIHLKSSQTFTNAKDLIPSDVNWVAYTSITGTAQKSVADWVKEVNKTRIRKIKAVVFNQSADDKHVVNFVNTNVVRKEGGSITGELYLGRILGVLTSTPLNQSVTYKALNDLKSVTEPTDIDSAIGQGQLVLMNSEDKVIFARGVNSLTTVTTDNTEDMKYITIVEGMDLLSEDIVKTFRDTYVGKYKNNYDNQVLLISAINSYFRALATDGILDSDNDNTASVDVTAQRNSWITAGITDAQDWDDKTVKSKPFRTNVYIKANVKFLNSIEDLTFSITM